MTYFKRFRSLLAGAGLAATLGLMTSTARANGTPIAFPITSGSPLKLELPGLGGLPGVVIDITTTDPPRVDPDSVVDHPYYPDWCPTRPPWPRPHPPHFPWPLDPSFPKPPKPWGPPWWEYLRR